VISVCITRLAVLQLKQCDEYREQIERDRILSPTQLPTVRGDILDRRGRIVAVDKPAFYLQVRYDLIRLLDDRFWEATILDRVNEKNSREQVELQLHQEFSSQYDKLNEVIAGCAEISGLQVSEVQEEIR